eukprot:gnl/TRDRNA2_/TRDRNA2_160901_c0_seq4.p1 gnl/TRDRNA2_/TRDRNA2_160901_c0~~gnl/TRDRNA2_/TRDRNA2_160901_c0_seq4.p1  ORF type:complete len:378 (+),score=60.22 gnl/TRDRNA2_/TRDRNA2_160901_c0_seq4:947-2080(+)
MLAQNLSNTAWAFATLRMLHLPLFDAISSCAHKNIAEFDIQGLANTLWSFASLLLSDFSIISSIRNVVIGAISRQMPRVAPGQKAHDAYYDVSRYANRICQLVWSFSFSDMLNGVEGDDLGLQLRGLLLENGRRLDKLNDELAERPQPRGLGIGTPQGSERVAGPSDDPKLVMRLRGVSVVLKPPNWEVDAKGQLSSSGYYLSNFMQRAHSPSPSPVLCLSDFEYGFIHRLDIPSSGLILTGTHFEGYALLQWQMHCYQICREYSVLLCELVPSTLCDINERVHDFLPGRSFVDESGRPAETHLKVALHVRRAQHFHAEYFAFVTIAIHTGRRHQIRVHTQWQGHPTVTDEKYSQMTALVTSLGLEHEVSRWLRFKT